MRAYHRDEDFRVVKLRDDLVSAMRYAIMMRRSGRALSECEGIGYGNLPLAKQRAEGRRSGQQFARGTANHPDGDNFDIFTGAP
jgi:hypothetical protein